MKAKLKVNATLSDANTNLDIEKREVWLLLDNTSPIELVGGYENEEMPILDELYVEKSHAWHMYFAQLEQKERKMKWEKVSTNL